jgi:hypothetical protein
MQLKLLDICEQHLFTNQVKYAHRRKQFFLYSSFALNLKMCNREVEETTVTSVCGEGQQTGTSPLHPRDFTDSLFVMPTWYGIHLLPFLCLKIFPNRSLVSVCVPPFNSLQNLALTKPQFCHI